MCYALRGLSRSAALVQRTPTPVDRDFAMHKTAIITGLGKRILALWLFAAATVVSAQSQDTAPGTLRVYVGTYTSAASEGIYLFEFEPDSGALAPKGLAAKTANPSFLALHPDRPCLYAVGENGGETGGVSAFAIDPARGGLTLINTRPSRGGGPCHVAVAPGGGSVAVANYGGGSVCVIPLASDGGLAAASAFAQHTGHGPNAGRQEGPHAHGVTFDPSGKFLFVPDLGIDRVVAYRFDRATGAIDLDDAAGGRAAPGAGPRHVVFHPGGTFAYAVNELDSSVAVFRYDVTRGAMETIQSISTLPLATAGTGTTAEIAVHPSGRFLYASNRGHDSIASFAIERATGTLTALGHTSTGGKTPRNFNLDPSGRFLLAANQESGNIVVFRIDPESGIPQPAGIEAQIDDPVCIVFDHR